MLLKHVAPSTLIRRDYEMLQTRERLDTTRQIQELIFIQSMEGRAHNGAGFFQKRSYVNTTVDDIVRALERDPIEVKVHRQRLIDEIRDWCDAALKTDPRRRLVNGMGEPLLGIPWFRDRPVDPADVLKGIYMGGLRDNPETRRHAEERYEVRIGFGRCYLVNIEVMDSLGHDGESLAHQAHEDEIPFFRQEGLIIDPEDLATVRPDLVRYIYIRWKEGPGHSDDACICMAGLLYNADVALGVFLADAIDTLEKYVLDYRDQDDELSERIAEGPQGGGATDEEVYELTYLASIPEGMEESWPDSSMRYLLSVGDETGQTALRSHLAFVEKRSFFPMPLAYNRIPSTLFYKGLKDRLLSLERESVLPDRTVSDLTLEKPASEMMDRKFIVIHPATPLREAMARARAAGCERIIVQDGQGKVHGMLEAAELIRLIGHLRKGGDRA